QDWLRLAGHIPADAEPVEVASMLFRGLGFESDPFTLELSGLADSDRGLERLRVRIEQAIQHRDRFREAVEDGLSVDGATVVWIEAREATAEVDSAGPVEATATTWPIQFFAD